MFCRSSLAFCVSHSIGICTVARKISEIYTLFQPIKRELNQSRAKFIRLAGWLVFRFSNAKLNSRDKYLAHLI